MPHISIHTFALYLALLFSALVGAVIGLSQFAGMDYLAGALVPLSLVAVLAWALYAVLRHLAQRDDENPLVSGLGPEGIMLQRATASALGRAIDSEAGRHFAAGEVHFQGGDYEAAAVAYRNSVDSEESLAADLNLAAALLSIADFQGAREALTMGYTQAQRQRSREYEAAFLLNMGALHARQGKLVDALGAYREAQRHHELLGGGRGLGDALVNTGQAQAHLGRGEAALESGERALAEYEETGSEPGRAAALGCMGYAHSCRDEFPEALEYFQQALAIHKELGNALGQGHVLTHMGNVRFKEEDYEGALEAYARASTLHGAVRDALGEASAMVNMGNVHFRQGELDAAQENYDEAFRIHERAGNVMGQARALTNIGSLLARQRRVESALDTLQRARGFYLEVGDDSRGLQSVEKLIARLEAEVGGTES